MKCARWVSIIYWFPIISFGNGGLPPAQPSGLIKPDTEGWAVLEHLVEGENLEAQGQGKGRGLTLSEATYRHLGEKSAYVRTGFEPFQQEQMILQYVETHGRIIRR